MIRDLVSKDEIDEYYLASQLLYSNRHNQGFFVEHVMEYFFAPYIYLYEPRTYIEFMNVLGFRIVGWAHLNPISSINHEADYHSGVLIFKRQHKVDASFVCTELISPEKSVDQLDMSLHKNQNPKMLEAISTYKEVKSLLCNNKMLKMALCFGLFQIISSDNIEKKFPIKGEKIKPNYDELIQLLRSVSRKLD